MRRPKKIDWDKVPLGERPVEVIARELKVRNAEVSAEIRKRGIPSFSSRVKAKKGSKGFTLSDERAMGIALRIARGESSVSIEAEDLGVRSALLKQRLHSARAGGSAFDRATAIVEAEMKIDPVAEMVACLRCSVKFKSKDRKTNRICAVCTQRNRLADWGTWNGAEIYWG